MAADEAAAVSAFPRLSNPPRLVPCHIEGKQPQYLVVSGLVFTVVLEPYLANEYGADYGSDAPVKLLDLLIHGKSPSGSLLDVMLSLREPACIGDGVPITSPGPPRKGYSLRIHLLHVDFTDIAADVQPRLCSFCRPAQDRR